MNRRISWGECRQYRPLPKPRRQLNLFEGLVEPRPSLDSVCARCGRTAVMWVRNEGSIEGRCDWHVTERLPLAVRRRSFR